MTHIWMVRPHWGNSCTAEENKQAEGNWGIASFSFEIKNNKVIDNWDQYNGIG